MEKTMDCYRKKIK